MKVTAITQQARNKSRVNVSIDGKYRLSLDIVQLPELGIKVGSELSEKELTVLEEESQYGKLYTRALEYALTRPRSQRELKDYLYRKTHDTRLATGAIKKGVSVALTERVFATLTDKGYVNDEKFARFWIENRNVTKGTSLRRLSSELASKGVERSVVDELLAASYRDDEDELQKVISKKRRRYSDDQKFMSYLARQGFSYDDIKSALAKDATEDTDSL